jgi:DNA polymerase III alpha subunit
MQRAVELGHTTYFIGEHGFQGNLYEAQTLCEKYNLKPIYSVEAYYVDDITDKSDRKSYHIMLIGMTKKARYEINKIMSIANTEGFYYKPRIGLKELLSLTPTDTIVTTACIASRLSELLEYDDKGNFVDYANVEKQQEVLESFLLPVYNHFGKNLYLEVQSHKDIKQVYHNRMILALHNKYDIPLIHANDSHYILERDSYYRDLFLQAKGVYYKEESGFVLDYPDYDTVLDRYRIQGVLTQEQAKQALDNTLIFDNAEPVYTDKEFKIPKVPNKFIQEELHDSKFSNEDSDKVLQEIILRAWSKKKGTVKAKKIPEYKKAICYEMDIVKKCGMADYFVLDHMIVNRAVNKYGAVLTRSGRGSAVSFLINHLLGLTEVDRIKAPTKLYPTRFMSAERILSSRSLPDIDLNWSNVEPAIQASKDILGEDGIYYMVAFKPLQRSSAFRLWCKARGYDINDYDEVAKLLGEKDYSDDQFKEEHPKWAIELEHSKVFRGVIESVAPSPCSFLLSNNPISEEVGLIKVGDVICCAMDGYNCDVYKFLKNDLLTVKVYEIIDKTYKLIGRPIDDIATLVNNCDDKVWKIYEKGLTTTINQADSDMGKQLIMRYKPKSLAELSAWVAAIRPGFASLLNNFLDRLPYSTGVEDLDNLLDDSFHYLLYQESIMAYLVWLGIEEKGTYDIIKKIAKKKFKEEELQALKEQLVQGWVKNVGTEDGFEETWQVVEDAARYSFNASHALSVAIDSLYGAYLKSHYPLEYFTVALSLYSDDMERTANLVEELKYFGIKIENIKFGKSGSEYMMDKETNSIYKSVSSIKYCNTAIADELLELSKNHYNNFVELIQDINTKTSVNSRQLEILTGLCFFEQFGKNAYLLEIIKLCNGVKEGSKIVRPALLTCKQLKKDKLESYGISEYLARKYSEKETEKQYSKIDNVGLLGELVTRLENKSMNIVDQIKFEKEYLEYVIYMNTKVNEQYYIVTDYKTFKEVRKPYCVLHRIKTGEDIKTRIKSVKVYESAPFGEYSILKVKDFTMTPKTKNVNGEWVQSEELEPILTSYEVIK